MTEIFDVNWNWFNYKSNSLQFFRDENTGKIYSTNKKSKSGDFIYHPYFLYYDLNTGQAHHIKLGRIKYKKSINYSPPKDFEQELLQLVLKAEESHDPFKQVLDITFNNGTK